jgi:phosphatidylglycerophosphate synthase
LRAFPITNLIAKIKFITPNSVTIVSGILGLLAAYYFFLNEILIGTLYIYFSFLLDCVDGNLARKTKRTSKIGAKLDNTTDTIKKAACIVALIYISTWDITLLIALVLLHYGLQRIYSQKYSKTTLTKFAALGLEPLFSSYDLLVILLLFGPMLGFEYFLIIIICLQIIMSVYSRRQ